VGVAPGRLSQGPDDVQPPHGEWPCDRYGLQGVSWEVGFMCVKLAPLTGAHDLVGISDRGGPIEALAERVAHEGARCRVVATHACVDVSNKFATVGNGDASLQDAGCGALVQLVVDYSERLGFPGDAPGFGLRGVPLDQSRRGTWPTNPPRGGQLSFHSLGFVHIIPLE
jgi:hypothetical protein